LFVYLLVSDISTFIDPTEETASNPATPVVPREPIANPRQEGPAVFTPDNPTEDGPAAQVSPPTPKPSEPAESPAKPLLSEELAATKTNDDGAVEGDADIGFSEVIDKGVAAIASSANYFTGFLSVRRFDS